MNDMASHLVSMLSVPAANTESQPIPVDHDPFAGTPLVAFAPVTESQSEIWLAAALEPRLNLAYNEGLALNLDGTLDIDALRRALQALVERHESLRATFSPDGVWMCIAESIAVALDAVPLDHEADPAEAFQRAAADAMGRPLDLEHGPLFRFELYRLSPTRHKLVFIAHHIVCDGWSMAQLLVELGAFYSAAVEKRPLELSYAADRYTEYAALEKRFLDSAEGRAQLRWWLDQLQDAPAPVELPADRPRGAQRGFAAARYDHPLPADLTAELRRFGGAQGASLVMTLLATLTAQLHRLGGIEDCVIGLAAAGQSLHQRPHLVGHCVNFLPLRLRPRGDDRFGDLLQQTRRVVLDAYDHQGVTFGALLPKLNLDRDESRPPLISIVFNVDVRDDDIAHSSLNVAYDSLVRQYDSFELFLNVVDNGRDLVLECSYNTELFDEATMRRRMHEFEQLLRGGAAHLATPLRELRLVDAAERLSLLENFNGERAPLPQGTLHAAIARTAMARADAIAVQSGEQQLSFAGLIHRADAIAQALLDAGVKPGEFVGVCLERGVDLPAALLGVLKTGAAYLPLDPELPESRLQYMVADAGVRTIVCQKSTASAPGHIATATVMAIDDLPPHSGPSINVDVADDAPAYAIYTSGSTGQPKGVVTHHRGVLVCLDGTRQRIGIDEQDALLAIATYAFDASVLELFLPLVHGARLVVATRDQTTDGKLLAAAIERHAITRIFTAPAAWRLLLSAGWSGKRDLIGISWAEPLTPDLAAELLPRLKELWNLYGPTETTVWMLGARIVDADAPITIGAPIPNTRAYVLDRSGEPAPVGVAGELCIGGAGVGLGYLQRPELTAEKFVDDPFVPGGRLYRTGDLARWTEHGEIVCLGRADHQIKLRGFRIEPGEIEALLKSHDEIADAVCGVRERVPGDPRLVAWVQAAPGTAPSANELRRHLRATLPGYMVPQHFALLDALPRLPNGKLDRKRLPNPFEAAHVVEGHAPAAPRSPNEQRMAALWRELLGHEAFGPHDRFLDIGGHSLLAAQLAARLQQQTGSRPPLREVMTGTLAQLARLYPEAAGTAELAAGPAAAVTDGATAAVADTSQAADADASPMPTLKARGRSLWERWERLVR